LTTVRLEISRESVVVRLPVIPFSMTIPNTISLNGKFIVGIGDVGVDDAGDHSQVVTKPAFDAADFDPDVAGPFTRWAFGQAMSGSGIGWRRWLSVPDLEIDWAGWGSIPRDRRQRFLTPYRTFRVDINGRPAVQRRVDVPLLRGLFGTRIDPGP
jgi:hypothetical protein